MAKRKEYTANRCAGAWFGYKSGLVLMLALSSVALSADGLSLVLVNQPVVVSRLEAGAVYLAYLDAKLPVSSNL